jgi:hypothetical protein
MIIALSGRVFPRCIAKLLDGLNRVLEQHLFPSLQVWGGPVAVYSFDRGNPEIGYLGKEPFRD